MVTVWPGLRRDGCASAAHPGQVFFVDADDRALARASRMLRGTAIRLDRFDFDAERMYDESGMQTGRI